MTNNTITVNGPINAVRISGSIFGINKILYLFMDHHSSPENQTECDNVLSEDFNKYLVKSVIKNPNITFDLFLEYYSTYSLLPTNDYRDRYIDQMAKLFRKEFNYDEKTDRVYPAKSYPNARFHYIDIRDYLYHNIDIYLNNLRQIVSNMNCNMHFTRNDLYSYESNLMNIFNELTIVYEMLMNKRQNGGARTIGPVDNKQRTSEENESMLFNFLDKILNKYNHIEVKQQINKYIENLIIPNIKTLMKLIEKTLKYINKILLTEPKTDRDLTASENIYGYGFHYGIDSKEYHKIIQYLHSASYDIDYGVLVSFGRIIDAYFLRRFLDKDYIQHGVVYTGSAHSTNYIYLLLKYFDFEITNTSYSLEPNVEILNQKLKEIDYKEDADFEKYFLPPQLLQCSNLTNFPKNLT